jgi:hypothetical protein
MDEREQQRKIRHRLAMIRHAEEVTGNVALTCRYYGISRPTPSIAKLSAGRIGEMFTFDKSSACPLTARLGHPFPGAASIG